MLAYIYFIFQFKSKAFPKFFIYFRRATTFFRGRRLENTVIYKKNISFTGTNIFSYLRKYFYRYEKNPQSVTNSSGPVPFGVATLRSSG